MLTVLTFTPKLWGTLAPDLSSHFYDEFCYLSSYVNLVVMVEGVEVRVDAEKLPFKVISVPGSRLPKIRGLSRLACFPILTRLLDFEVIYLRTFSPHELLSSLVSSRPIVLRVIGTWIFEPPTMRNKVYLRLYRKVLEKAKFIVPYSYSQLEGLLRYHFNIDPSKVVVIPNALNLTRLRKYAAFRSMIRAKLGAATDEVIVMFVGAITYRKGVHILFDAWRRLSQDTKARLVLIGRIDKNYLSRLKIPRKVQIVGPIPNERIGEYLSAADVFVLPSIGGEGVSRATLEALALGLPLIVTDVGGMRELSGAALLIKPGDPNQLAQALSQLLRSEELRKELSRKAKAFVERFSWEEVIPKLVTLFKEAVK